MRFAYLTGIACRPDKRSASGTVQELTVMSSSRPVFRSRWLPYLLVAPQLIITVIFYLACGRSVVVLATKRRSVWFLQPVCRLDNFVTLFHDSYYLDSFWTTIKFSTFVTVSGLLVSLFFAALVEYIVRGSRFYQTLMLLPYAVAPPLPPYCGSSCLTPVAG